MKINLAVPKGWNDLSQRQLRSLFNAMVYAQSTMQFMRFRDKEDYMEQCAAYVASSVLLDWKGLEIVCPYDDGYLMKMEDTEFKLTAEQLAAATEHLSWIKELPEFPVRLDKISGRKAIPADLSEGISFDSYLACENNWQAYQMSQDASWLQKMADILYAKQNLKMNEAEVLSIFYWWAGVKNMLSEMFPNFFKPSAGEESPELSVDSIRRNVDAQIRALTKGDVTKEKQVLAMDALRALTELDAQAREYEELNRKYPSK